MTLPRSRLVSLLVPMLLLLLLGERPAHAQPLGKTLVVPFLSAQTKPVPFSAGRTMPADEARQIERALGQRHVVLLSLHEAHDRFLARSRVPQQPGASDIDQLAKEAQAAIQHVALGRTSAAQQSVQHIVALAERSLETLNRETSTARGLLDACLALVRAALHDNKRDEAIDQAMRCRRLVPDLAPSDVAHPASVVGALAEADDQLRRMRVGGLRVTVDPERACELYLNGRHLGHTPFALERAPAGNYRVQLECPGEAPSRVHWLELGDEPVALSIDPAFDTAIMTEPRLALHYASDAAARAALQQHGSRLGRAVGADDVILVGRSGGKLLMLRVQTKPGLIVAGQRLEDTLPASYAHAAETLAQARFEGVATDDFQPRSAQEVANALAAAAATGQPASTPPTAKTLAPMEPPPPLPPPPAPPPSNQRAIVLAGGMLAGLGVAGIAAGYGLYAHSVNLRHEAEDGVPGSDAQREAQADYDAYRIAPVLAGVAGAALASAAVPMLLPREAPRSTAAWVGGALAGAAGVALVVVGGMYANKGGALGYDGPLGGLIIATSGPLLTIPITQIARAMRAPAKVPYETPVPTRASPIKVY
jgi:hypothetical protein